MCKRLGEKEELKVGSWGHVWGRKDSLHCNATPGNSTHRKALQIPVGQPRRQTIDDVSHQWRRHPSLQIAPASPCHQALTRQTQNALWPHHYQCGHRQSQEQWVLFQIIYARAHSAASAVSGFRRRPHGGQVTRQICPLMGNALHQLPALEFEVGQAVVHVMAHDIPVVGSTTFFSCARSFCSSDRLPVNSGSAAATLCRKTT